MIYKYTRTKGVIVISLLIILILSGCSSSSDDEEPFLPGQATVSFIPYATPTDEPARPAQINDEFDLINCPMDDVIEWLDNRYSLSDFQKNKIDIDKWNYIYIFSPDGQKKISKYGVEWDWMRIDSNVNSNGNLKSIFFYLGTSMTDYKSGDGALNINSIDGEEAIRIYNDLSEKLISDYGEPISSDEQSDMLTKTWFKTSNIAAQLILAFDGDERTAGKISLSFFKDTSSKGFTGPATVTPTASAS